LLLTLTVTAASAATWRDRDASRAVPAEFPAKGRLADAKSVTMVFGGLSRHYLIQTPLGSGPFPVLVLLHGGTQTAEQIWRQTSLPTLAHEHRFILVAPDGIERHWNDGRGSTLGGGVSTADDVGFLAALIAQVLHDHRGDARAVFMTGVSNGGLMTMRFACERADLLRAAGNVISDLPVALHGQCRPAKPLPWISINGTADPLMPFAGAPASIDRRGEPQPALMSADATFDFWASRDGCSAAQGSEPLPDLDPSDGSRAERRVRRGCAGGMTSTQYVLTGAGHVAPGFPVRGLVQAIIGSANMDIDMGTVVWQHFAATLPAPR
jgi:polyhydroxybutyrate depolymerase